MNTPTIDLYRGDCLTTLRNLPDNSVDSIVTDPPYGLSNTDTAKVQKALTAWVMGARDYVPEGKGFMGQAWDSFVPPPAVWDECYRVLKPGGHMAVFAGSRTQDLMGMSIRLAGFDLRDSVAWLYGQGFPKSQNVSKSDKFCQCEAVDLSHATTEATEHHVSDMPNPDVPAAEGPSGRPGEVLLQGVPEHGAPAPGRPELRADQDGSRKSRVEGRSDLRAPERELRGAALRPVPGGVEDYGTSGRLRDGAPAGHGGVDRAAAVPDRSGQPQEPRPAGQQAGESGAVSDERRSQEGRGRAVCSRCSKPVVPSGLGTALKPGHEPIILARKPFPGTVAGNVQEHGTGALNIDATRTGLGDEKPPTGSGVASQGGVPFTAGQKGREKNTTPSAGRWPANVILDEDQAAALDEQSGTKKSGSRKAGTYRGLGYQGSDATEYPEVKGDSGGASRFFYVAKAGKKERPSYVDENGDTVSHTTVKPVALMRWLVRLITPPGGTVLEPFAGTGTTGQAAALEGFACIMIERHEPYLPLIRARMDALVERIR